MGDAAWPVVTLADVADLRLSSVDKKTTTGESKVRLCNYSDVYNNRVLRADMDYMEATGTEREIKNCRLKVGDVVITKDSETPDDIGVPAVVREEVADLVCGYHLAILRPQESALDGEYLNYSLGVETARRQFRMYANGITRFGLRAGDIERVSILLPPLPEQLKIAAILSSVDDAIEKTQAVIDQVQVVKRGLMQELLTRGLPGRHTRFKQTEIGEIPEEWGLKELGDIASVGNGTTPSKKREDYWQGGTIAWLPTGRVNDRVIRSASVFVTKEAVRQTSLRVLPVGTLLVAMIGQGKTRGKTAFLEIEACVNQNFAYVIPRNAISPEFLFCILEHQYEALRAFGRGSNQGALNCQLIKRFKVPLPTTDEQCKITYGMSTLDTRLEVERLRVECLGYVKEALMSVLLTGELRVTPDPETI